MTTHNFTQKEIFGSAWAKTKEHSWYIFCLFIAFGSLMGAAKSTFFFSPFVALFVGIAIIAVSLVIVRGGHPTLHDVTKSFRTYKITWHYITASILTLIICLIGLVFLIIPGIYLAIRLQFYKMVVVDNENMKGMDAIEESMKITEGNFWKLFTFTLIVVLINILGAIPLGLGLIITVPVSLLAYAELYKRLSTHHHAEHHAHEHMSA
jgi:uncharacterized membrane protein